ncbi:hypothetical protein [Enterobacter sp. RIT418]|uniref:hypothetical protein n=1 Tax=Enterobacter sp. RIT418 TaxID=2202164 RepID=UPI00215D2EAC|nr:hypothetical protein [Enterobacter sp. RIT 418]
MEFTKEQLKEIIETDHVQCGEASALARVSLASLEAEAVAWTDEQELRDVAKDGCGYLFTVKPITPHADPRRVIKLYTAPPAPVVPDVVSWEDVPEEITEDDVALASAWAHGFNQCRAAMLQGAEQTNYRAIVERIAETVHGKVTDIDLLTVTVKSMKDKLHK